MDIQKSSAAVLSRPGTEFAGLKDMNMPWFESPFFEPLLKEQSLSPEDETLVRSFAKDGYVVLDDLKDDTADRAERIIRDLGPKYGSLGRIQDAWKSNSDVKELAVHPRILEILKLFYQRDPIPFQTLNFAAGTEQSTHSDTVHFHSVPHRFMCGVWVALEDIVLESGPLHVYSGSHSLPVWNFHDLGLPSGHGHYHEYEEGIARYIDVLGLKKKIVLLNKGQALVWAANVLHGGEPILDKAKTRHSQVTHYYFADCLYYTPMLSDPYIGRMHIRRITDIRTGERVPNKYDGKIITAADGSDTGMMGMGMGAGRPSFLRRVVRKLKKLTKKL